MAGQLPDTADICPGNVPTSEAPQFPLLPLGYVGNASLFTVAKRPFRGKVRKPARNERLQQF